MDKWNLHTIDNKGIKPTSLKLYSVNNSTKIKDIVDYILENTKLNIKDICSNL